MDTLLAQLKLAVQITEKINQGESFDEIFDSLFRDLCGLIPCDRLAIGFLHADGHTLILGPVRSHGQILLGTGYKDSSLEYIFEDGKPRIINDLVDYLSTHPQSKTTALIVKEGLRSSLTLPLVTGSRSIGVMWFFSVKEGAYLSEHESFMRLIAGHLAIVLEKARLAGSLFAGNLLKGRLRDENIQLREIIARSPELTDLIGESVVWQKTLRQIQMVASTDATVLIQGETGTGKELIARAVHNLSARKDKPFIAINCGALSPELIASELFGHEKGSFTGAAQRKFGRLELARDGTFFLDEVAELPADMQVKLLRVLQEREFERVGGTQTIRSGARIIAATNRNLETERATGRFRDDLFFRLNVFPIRAPALRERKEDIAPLLNYFLHRYAQKVNRKYERIDPRVMAQCMQYDWPGNIRELENLVERGTIICEGPVFLMDVFEQVFEKPRTTETNAAAPKQSLIFDDVIRTHLLHVLTMTQGKVYGKDGAAHILGLKPSTLQAKLKKYGIEKT